MNSTTARSVTVERVIRETFFPIDGEIRTNMRMVIESAIGQNLFKDWTIATWCYTDVTLPLMVFDKISQYVDESNDTPLDYEMLENVLFAVYYFTRNCEDMSMIPELIKDIGQVSLEEYMLTIIPTVKHTDIENLMLNLLDRLFRRTDLKRPVDIDNVLEKPRRVLWLLKRLNAFIINRDVNTIPDYYAECDTETNGPDSDPLIKAFGDKEILPNHIYTINMNDDNPALKSENENDSDNDDFFDYSSRVHAITRRYCNHSIVKCPCMYSCRYVNPETPFAKHKGYKIDEESYRDLCAIISELPTCIVSDDPRKDYKNHFVVRIALTTADKNIHSACSRSKDEIMAKVNRLRSFYVGDLSPGLRLQYEKFVAEEDDDTPTLVEKMKRIFETVGDNMVAGVKKVVEVVKNLVVSISEFISEKISQLIETLFTKIAGLVIDQFDIEAFIKRRMLKLKDGVLTNGRKVAFFMIVIMFLIATEILGIFVFRFAAKIIFSITGLFRTDNECFNVTNTEPTLVTEGMGPLGAVTTMACAGFGLASGQTKLIKEKCDFLSSVLRAGTGISLMMGSVFVLLPTIFKDTIVMAWGSPEDKDAVLCEDWIIKSTCILRLSKIAKVLASPEMSTWIKEQLAEIPTLVKKIQTTGHRSMVLKIYSDLLRISSNLEQYHNSDNSRSVPYSIHLSAEPGYGKSLLTPIMINKAFDYAVSDIYTRNQTEEYWSGYIAQPVVFVDEFLVNRDPQVVNRSADEYLKLISPSKFTPEFATTDNIIMGLKGTTVSPHIVITANNTVYGTVASYPKGAMDRRRRFVIEMVQNPARRELWTGKNSIDVSRMTVEDLNNASWLLFNIRNNSRENPITLHLNMNFKSLVAFLRDDMKRYQEDCKKMSDAFTSTQEIQEDPTEKLIAMMAEMKGAPRGTIDYDNPISGLFTTATRFFAEGGTKGKKKFYTPNSSDTDTSTSTTPSCLITPTTDVHLQPSNLSDVTVENFCSDEEDVQPPPPRVINRDVMTDLYCSNVDRDQLHRHICLCCNRHKAVKSCDGGMYLRCVDCERAKRRIMPEQVKRLILSEPLVITEEEMESLREQRVKDLKKLLAASHMTMIYNESYPYTVWEDVGMGHDYYEFAANLSATWKSRAKMFAVIISVYVGIMYIRRLLNKQARETEPSTLTFIPESQSRRKETQTKNANRYKATNWKGEGSSFTGLKYYLKVNGTVLGQQNGMPICASKFITHRHSLLNEKGEIYTHGEITVCYKDCMDTVPFSCNMIRELKINDNVSDFVMICLPPRMKINGFPNVLNKFWRDEDFAKFNGGDVCIVQPDGSTATTRVSVQNHRNYAHHGNTFHISTALTYTGVGNGPGWCGLLLESYGNICPGMFIGMHVAGSGTKGRSDGLYGLALPITREMLEQLINFNDLSVVPETVDFSTEGSFFQGPGLVNCEMLPPQERVILSRVSKIRPSIIAPEMPEEPKKHLPLLSPNDPRANNEDPLVNMINDTLSRLSPSCDEQRADRAVAGTMHHMRRNLTWVFPKRRLTFEEAVGGIPGLLTSMNRHTSAGYPLCKITKGQGKKEYFWFGEDGKLGYDPLFKDLVMNFVESFDRGECEKGRFVAYLKDELVSAKKIDQRRCRIIYGGDMIANTAFRMIFGSFVIAYNHSYDKLSHVVGLNQYSFDMDMIFSYLREVGTNFVAGDFKGWDKNMNAYIQRKVYTGIMQTCASLINARNYESFYQHQVKSPVIVEKYLLTLENTQFSGCFFTTILNCLVHDAMLRYIFDLACENAGVQLDYETHVRSKILGDDHIYSFSDDAAKLMNPKTIQAAYKTIGSEYTDDLKDAEVTEQFRTFEELTFLGAHPRKIDGKWVGALKKDTIDEMVLWTRNFNEDLLARCQTAIEMSSLWGEEYYIEKAATINHALRRKNFPQIEVRPWLVMIHEVANRTAASEATFPRYLAEGNEGLVNLNASETKSSDGLNMTTMMTKLRSKAVAEIPQDLSFGLESTVFRDSFEWKTTDIAGVAIKSIALPFGLLGLGDADNVQNMPFDRFLFWNGDVKLTLQVNGTPFMCGLLAVYFMPLASYQSELANISTTNHVYLQPDKNNTVEITIPYLYFRTVMNTVARTTESLGTVYVTPISPLSSVGGEPVTISLYSSFHNSAFSVPRPLPVTTARAKRFYTVTGVQQPNDLTLPVTYIAEGAGQSTTVHNNYTNVGGTMPISDITNTPTADLNFAPDISTDLKVPVGLDNPPLASGAIPVEMAFPGFSTSYGVRPTRDLQLMPATFARQQCMIFDPAETRIDVNCMRNCLMTTIPITTSMASNTTLVELSLDSRLNVGIGNNIPVNMAVLNQFHFWRGDIEFTFVMVRTQYHSCRLQGVVAYGVDAIEAGSRSVAYSNVMDFSGENSVNSMTIQFNAQTEFLRTYEGSKAVDTIQNHSLGTFGLFITNQLVAPETVPQTIELLMYVRFLDVKVAVPRAFSPFTWNGYGELNATTTSDVRALNLPTPAANFFGEAYFRRVLPIFVNTSDLAALPLGKYTASGTMEMKGTGDYAGLTWTSEVLGVEVFEVTSVKCIGVTTDNMSLAGHETGGGGTVHFLVNTPRGTLDWFASLLNFTNFTIKVQIPVAPTFFAEGAEGTEVADIDHVETSEITADSETRPNIPHKVEPLSKFEFCPTDIIEIGRRYVRSEFTQNPNLDQVVEYTYLTTGDLKETYIHAATQLSSMWRGLFAAWAGSIKYRFFTKDEAYLEVMFQPFFNGGTQFGLSAGDVRQGSILDVKTKEITAETSVVGPYAREMGYPSWRRQYVDVSVPFQSHFNFLFTSKTQAIAPISSGTITLSGVATGEEIRVYTAFGDDLRLGVYRPPRQTKLSFSAYVDGINGYWV